MKLKQLTEAKYAKGRTVYFVSAFDPEDGDMEQYAGPFQDKEMAKKFVQVAHATTEKAFVTVGVEDAHRMYLPNFHVQKIMDPETFLRTMNEHIETMFG